jgi:general secretion pathway protein H
MVQRHTLCRGRLDRCNIKINNGGFSLLELIIVLVIIGVLVAAITLSITDTRRDKLHLEARKLGARLSLARDEAILTNQELGVEVERNLYRFLFLGEEHWEVMSADGENQLVEQNLPEGMELQLKVEGLFSQFQSDISLNKLFRENDENEAVDNTEEDVAKTLRPQIYLMSSGELNPFIIFIGYDDETPVFYTIEASFDGKITIEGPSQESMRFAMSRATDDFSESSP